MITYRSGNDNLIIIFISKMCCIITCYGQNRPAAYENQRFGFYSPLRTMRGQRTQTGKQIYKHAQTRTGMGHPGLHIIG